MSALLGGMCAAQTPPRAILADGDGPWRDSNWTIAASEFSRLLIEAGYAVTTVSPVDLPSALNTPDILLAMPSLENLPFDTFTAVAGFLAGGGSLMATGGEPFRDPLYLAPDGRWLDSAAYQAAVGSPPPQGPFTPPVVETLSPWYKQYVPNSWPSNVRIPIARGRGLSAAFDGSGRYRVIGDLLAPSATLYVTSNSGALIGWLPWPQLFDPQRAQLVTALHAARKRLYLLNAGVEKIVTLPGEHVTIGASILNASSSAAQASLQWTISGPSGVVFQSSTALSLAAGELQQGCADAASCGGPWTDAGVLPNGDYAVTARLMIGDEEVDHIDSTFRVFDPTSTRQPDQKIRAVNGSFYVGNRRVFLQGVNYWPRYLAGLESAPLAQDWLTPTAYDPDLIEADLSEIASLNFNLIDIIAGQNTTDRPLIDFLERCRNHGIWVRIFVPELDVNSPYPEYILEYLEYLGEFLNKHFLPGNDRVFAYELLWEPWVGGHDHGARWCRNGTCGVGRMLIDPDWRAWVNDQYGSLANAQQAWGFAPPLDSDGQLTNPLDEQMANDGPWRIMVAAYHRFADDYFGRNLGLAVRAIHRIDPDTLLSYRNGATMTEWHNEQAYFDIGTAAAHLDFFSPENYDGSLTWPDDRKWGLVTAYSRYRTGGKPVQWTEFGVSIGPNDGTPISRAAEAGFCDAMMRQVNDDGSSAATVWWWPGGWQVSEQSDYGIIDPDGTPRDCALVMGQWANTFAKTPPDQGSGAPVVLTVDRDADARGEYALSLDWQDSYVQARQAGRPVILRDEGTGTDTSTMPLIQAGNVPYNGVGPLKFANAEIGGIHIVCPTLDVTVENGEQVNIPSGAACQITPTLINTGEAQWLPAAASKGGVLLHASVGDAPLTAPVPSLQRIAMGPLAVTLGQNERNVNVTGRLRVQGVGDFGEILRLTVYVDPNTTGPCAVSLSNTGPIVAPAAGMSGTIVVTTAAGCTWSASSPQSAWVTFDPSEGRGSAIVHYTIEANTGPAREMATFIALHPVTVRQAAAPNPPLVQAPTLSTTKLEFGSQTIGSSSAAQTITVTNTGTGALSLAGIAIGGTNGADFTEVNTCGLTVAAQSRCTVSINFAPSATGTRTASLFITGNLSRGPATVSLTGVGTGTGSAPSIQTIQDVWNYTPGVAPGALVVIFGTALSLGPAHLLTFSGTGPLPTIANATSVTFNGTPAALLYVSPSQINALVPASVAPGPVQVVVQANGVDSAPFIIMATATLPAIYASPSSDGSSFFVTAALQGTGHLVGNNAVDSSVVRAALPGDILDLYMIGLGATADPSKFITDRNFAGAYPVSAQVTATVGGENAPVIFAGLTSPGLYLVRTMIPIDRAAGPQPIQVTAGAGKTGSKLVLMVGTPPANLIQNSSFESALAGNWNLEVNTSQGAAATIQRTTSTAVDGAYSVQISVTSAATANIAAVQLWQAGLPLQQGQIYRLQFWAKSDSTRTLRFDAIQNGGNFHNYGLFGAAPLGDVWQRYVVYFQATATDPASRVDFYFGDQTGSTWLDNVSLQ